MPIFSRQKRTYDYWVKELYKRGIDDAAFIMQHDSSKEVPYFKYIYPTVEDDKIHNPKNFADTDRGMKRYIGARYFLNKSNFDWYWSLTDDTLIDLNSLDTMMIELESKYDTEKDFVIKGNLLIYREKPPYYPQGGVGFLMSKAAVKKFVTFGAKWASKLSWPEDRFIGDIIQKLNISIKDVKLPYLFGFGERINPPLKKINDCNSFDECPHFIENGMLITQLTPLKKFVALHTHHHGNIKHIDRMNEIKKLKNCTYLYYYINASDMTICKQR